MRLTGRLVIGLKVSVYQLIYIQYTPSGTTACDVKWTKQTSQSVLVCFLDLSWLLALAPAPGGFCSVFVSKRLLPAGKTKSR